MATLVLLGVLVVEKRKGDDLVHLWEASVRCQGGLVGVYASLLRIFGGVGSI
jgi:hypothetical protein